MAIRANNQEDGRLKPINPIQPKVTNQSEQHLLRTCTCSRDLFKHLDTGLWILIRIVHEPKQIIKISPENHLSSRTRPGPKWR